MTPEEMYRIQNAVNLIRFHRDKLLQVHNGERYSKVMPLKTERRKMDEYGIIERVDNIQAYRVKLSDFAKEALELE